MQHRCCTKYKTLSRDNGGVTDRIRRWFSTSNKPLLFLVSNHAIFFVCCANNINVFYTRGVMAPLESQRCIFFGEAL